MNNKCVLIFIFLFGLNSLKSQIILRGSIKDSLNTPIPYANVFVQKNDSSAIIAFGSSNDKGYYIFEMAIRERFIVKASAMGYATKTVVVDRDNKNTIDINFTLSAKELILKEAIVKANGKIIQKSDTTTFLADKFRDSTERNLEELLAKIPGIEVDKSGAITVQGQPIKKILIDGDDLTGRNYQLMSKNMSADVVDKIQVIDRFVENKLLRGIKRSEDKVINITLKENRKKLLFGNAVVGLGNDERTNNSLNLFGFYKKLKTISFGNFNTIGQISTADRMSSDEFADETEADNQHSLLKSRNSMILDIGRTPSVSLNSQSVLFNRAALASTHFTLKPTESLRFKGALTFSNDRSRSYINNDYSYLLSDSLFLLSESNYSERKPTVFEGHFDAEIDVSSKSLLHYKGDVRKSFSNNIAQTLANQNNIYNQLSNDNLATSNTLDFTYRLADNQAIMLNSVFILNDNTQLYKLNQTQPRRTPSVFLPSDSLIQSIQKPMTYFALNGQWLFVKNTFKVSSYVGYVQRSENLGSQLSAFYQNTPLVLGDNVKNDALIQQNNTYIGLNIKEEWFGIQWFSDISSGYYQTNVENKLNKNGYYALPTIGFKKKMNEKHTLFGTYTYNYALPQTVNLTNGYILTDYRSLERGSALFIAANSHTGILNYAYGNFDDEFLAHINIIHTTNNGGYRSNLGIDSDFNLSTKVVNIFANRNTFLSSSLERYMPKLYMRIKVRPSVSLSNYFNTLNGTDIRETQMVNSKLDISVRSAYLKWFNFHLGTTLNQSNVQTTVKGQVNTIKNKSIGSFLDFYLRINNRFNGKIENEVFYVKQPNNTGQKYYFVNASANYDIIKTKLSANLSARNLLNTKEFINSYVSDYATQTNRIRLLPRYVLLEINFRF